MTLEALRATSYDDTAGGVLGELIDLEGHVVVDGQPEQFAAFGGPQDHPPVGIERVVERHDVDLIEQVEGQSPELLLAQEVPALVLGQCGGRAVLAHVGLPRRALATGTSPSLPA